MPYCWHCEKRCLSIRVCEVCRTEGLAPSCFCSAACFEKAKPAHRVWHAKQKELQKERRVLYADDVRSARLEQTQLHKVSSKSHEKLLGQGIEFMENGKLEEALKTLRRASGSARIAGSGKEITECDFQLGLCLAICGHREESAATMLEVIKLGEASPWHRALGIAHYITYRLTCGEEAQTWAQTPDWWNEEGLKRLSAEAVEAAPREYGVWNTRAHVLSGCGAMWHPTPGELHEAGKSYQRAAVICGIGKGSSYEKQALHNAKICMDLARQVRAAQESVAKQTNQSTRLSTGTADIRWGVLAVAGAAVAVAYILFLQAHVSFP